MANAAGTHIAIEIVALIALHLGNALGAVLVLFLGADVLASRFAVAALGRQAGHRGSRSGSHHGISPCAGLPGIPPLIGAFIFDATLIGESLCSEVFIGAPLLGSPLRPPIGGQSLFGPSLLGPSFLGAPFLGTPLVDAALLGRRHGGP